MKFVSNQLRSGTVYSARPSGGFAIVLTLLVLSMMVVLVIGFNAATRTEQMAARNYSYQEQANQMAMMAVNQAVSILNTNLTNWSACTQPGRLMSQASGAVPLTSAAVPGVSGNRVNVNAWVDTNYFIARTTDRDAFSAPIVEVMRGTNRIGGYAFWVDDDGSRINLNAASASARPNFLPTNARPLVLSRDLFPSISSSHWNSISNGLRTMLDAPANATTNGWGYFFTPRQMVGISNVGAANYGAMMFQVGAGPPNWRPTNSYALGSNGVPAVLDTAAGFLSTYGSSGYADSLNTLTTALDTVSDSFFRGPNYQSYFRAPNGFAAKYGADILRQMMVNVNDAVLPASDDSFTGATAADMLAVPDNNGVNSVPRLVLGNRPSPYINEIAVAVAQYPKPPAKDGADISVELQIWMQCELVDPYRTGEGIDWEIKYNIQAVRFQGTYVDQNGVQGTFQNSQFSDPWSWEGAQLVMSNLAVAGPNNLYATPANAFVFEWQINSNDGKSVVPPIPVGVRSIQVTQVEVVPSLVVLARTPGDPLTVRDWAFGQDFSVPPQSFLFTVVPQASQPVQQVGGSGGWGPHNPQAYGINFNANGRSISKNDPRVRRFADYDPPAPAWIPGPSTLGAANATVNFAAGTGLSGIANDSPGTAGTDIYRHPSFSTNASGYALGRSNWVSSFDLSRVHTGLQWRTLQFRAQAQAESAAGHVPDWALLEAFRVTNAIASPPRSFKLNINALPYPAAGSMTAAELATAGLSRAAAAGSLLSGMVTNALSAVIGTNNLGFPAAAEFSRPAAAILVASNIANMTFTNTWTTRRSVNTNYQANLYSLPAEVLEVNGVSNFSTDEAANEARAQGVYSGIAVSSQIFTVYAAGFANDKQGTEVAEARLRAQVARDTNSGLFKVIFLEPLIWP